MQHYLARLQNATRNYWNKSALNTLDGESFTYGQMATLIEKFHLLFEKAGFKKSFLRSARSSSIGAGSPCIR